MAASSSESHVAQWLIRSQPVNILASLAPATVQPDLLLVHNSSEASRVAMSSSLSPDQLEGGTSRASTEGADKGVLGSLNLNFFKNLSSDKKVTRSKYSRHATDLALLRRAAADYYSSA